jgi:hypothetical protein
MTFHLNPFFTLLKASDLPQKQPKDIVVDNEDDDDESEEDISSNKERYIVNGLFGNEENASLVRVVLETEDKRVCMVCENVI